MRKLTAEQQKREDRWSAGNSRQKIICEGKFYIWNKAKNEICPRREECLKYKRFVSAKDQGKKWYDMPYMKFYYVSSFRRCYDLWGTK